MSETTDSDFMAVLDDGKFAKAIAKLPDYRGDAVALLVEAHALLADAVAMEHGANMTRDQLKVWLCGFFEVGVVGFGFYLGGIFFFYGAPSTA